MYTLLTQCFIRRRLDYRGEVLPDVNLNWFDDSVALEKELRSKGFNTKGIRRVLNRSIEKTNKDYYVIGWVSRTDLRETDMILCQNLKTGYLRWSSIDSHSTSNISASKFVFHDGSSILLDVNSNIILEDTKMGFKVVSVRDVVHDTKFEFAKYFLVTQFYARSMVLDSPVSMPCSHCVCKLGDTEDNIMAWCVKTSDKSDAIFLRQNGVTFFG